MQMFPSVRGHDRRKRAHRREWSRLRCFSLLYPQTKAPLIKLNIILELLEETSKNQARQGGKIMFEVFGAGSSANPT